MQPLLVSQGLQTLLMLVGLVVVFYLLLIRPMRKQAAAHQAKQKELRDGLAPGVRVQLAGGLFGTVKHVGNQQAIVELAPGMEVTVIKDSIVKFLEASDEEFEYEDDAAVAPAELEEPLVSPSDSAHEDAPLPDPDTRRD